MTIREKALVCCQPDMVKYIYKKPGNHQPTFILLKGLTIDELEKNIDTSRGNTPKRPLTTLNHRREEVFTTPTLLKLSNS